MTVERAWRLAPVMGITRIANVTGLDSIGLPVVMVCRPNSRSVAVSQGKGIDLLTAKASGLMESVESYHAETITLPLRLCSYEDLRYTHTVADPWTLPAVRTTYFSGELRMHWAEGFDLLREEPVFVPYEMVHTDFRWPSLPGAGCFVASSNGLASGNHFLEAVSHAICEVVERDAATLWMLAGPRERNRTRVRLSSIDDATCVQALEKFERAGFEVAVWDLTSDVGLAAFACVIRGRDERGHELPAAQGRGCHPARAIALLRALTEAAQSRLTLIAGSRDDIARRDYVPAADLNEPSAASAPAMDFGSVPDNDTETIDEDVEWELSRLRPAGIERVIVFDLSKEAFALPVVRVVVPGLEAPVDHPRYVPGARARRQIAR